MPEQKYDPNTYISMVLLAGVVCSIALMLLGLSMYAANFTPVNPLIVLNAGIALLIATPIMRVITSVFAFSMNRDGIYVLFSVLVLAVLSVSFLIGMQT